MRFATHPIARLEAWFDRRTAFLRHERAPFFVAVLVPILFGLLSIALGQDDNWDLRNYHWYNPYALLNGRLPVDMAPGNWQSYFNPLIDVPYYVLNQWLPGPAVGFVMGFVHGLNFILLLALVRLVLPRDKADMPCASCSPSRACAAPGSCPRSATRWATTSAPCSSSARCASSCAGGTGCRRGPDAPP
jgi:hypothetical protein